MNFTANNSNSNNILNVPNYNMISRQPIRPNVNGAPRAPPPVVAQPVDSSQELKRMKWGQPIWFLFHTLAEKIKDENFFKVRTELLNNIYSICSNLPCPTCATHAVQYLNKINFNAIQTKSQLKEMLFTFHNEVNSKKGYSIFSRSELDSKYSAAVTKNIIYNFISVYQDKHKSVRMIANDMFRTRQIIFLKEWFSKNIQYFDE